MVKLWITINISGYKVFLFSLAGKTKSDSRSIDWISGSFSVRLHNSPSDGHSRSQGPEISSRYLENNLTRKLKQLLKIEYLFPKLLKIISSSFSELGIMIAVMKYYDDDNFYCKLAGHHSNKTTKKCLYYSPFSKHLLSTTRR